jgi:hypothetical protein
MTLSTEPTPDVAPVGGHQGDLRVPEPRRRPRTSRVVLTVVLSVATLVCSVIVAVLAFVGGTSSVPAASGDEQLTQQFGAQVNCTEDLPAQVGAGISCTGADGRGVHHILVTATSVDGSQVNFTGTVED